MSTSTDVLTPAAARLAAAGHAAAAGALLAARAGRCHCDDEDCPEREPNMTGAALAQAHAATGTLFLALAAAMDAGPVPPPATPGGPGR